MCSGENPVSLAPLYGQRIGMLCPVLEVHYRVQYPRRQSGPTAFSSGIFTRVSRIALSEVALIVSMFSSARGETYTSPGAIHVARTRTTITRDRLLEEVLYLRKRLQLILVVAIRGKPLLLRGEEGARLYCMAARSAQPADVRVPVI